MRLPPRSDRRTSDRGNILIAVMVLLVLVTVGSALTYQVIGNGLIVVSRQRTSTALSSADAGLADALFRLNQGPAAEGSGTEFYVDTTNPAAPCSGSCVATSLSGIAAGSTVRYIAQQVNSTEWTIDSIGTSGAQTAAVHEVVTRSPSYPFALFANSALTFNGDASGSFSTYDDSAAASSTNPNTSGSVAIGSNGSITCNGGIGSNVQTDYYGTGSVSSLSTSCGNPQSFSSTYYLPPVSTAGLSGYSGCPNGGDLGSNVGTDATWSVLTTGTYLCKQPVTIDGLLTVTGPVTLYIDLSGNSSYNSSTAALTITSSNSASTNSYVNDLSDYCANVPSADRLPSVSCTPTPDLPSSQDLQIDINSDGQVGFANGPGYYFGGILYAPQAYLTEDGCKSHYFGSVTINTLTCNGAPHLYVSYDSSLGSVYGGWSVSSYTQENPSNVPSIP